MKAIVAGLFVFVFSATALAGDRALLDIVGFSADGKYFAFEQYGVRDGSGHAYSEFYFINVAQNIWAATPVKVLEDKSLSEVRKDAGHTSSATLKKLGIRIKNIGTQVISRPSTDRDAKRDSARFSVTPIVRGLVQQDYELTLREVLAPVTDSCKTTVDLYGDVKMLEVSLTNHQTALSKQVSQDASLPKSRGCVLSYGISDIYVLPIPNAQYQMTGSPYVTFVQMSLPGFDGEDVRYLAISGELN